MILQSLHALYGRLKDDPAYEIAPPGYSLQKISFMIVIRHDGSLVAIQDARIGERKTARQVRVLGETKSPGQGFNPCFLWDNTGYILGYKPDDDNAERTLKAFESFRNQHLSVEREVAAPTFSAVCRFLESWNPAAAAQYPVLTSTKSGFGVFKIVGETAYVHQDAMIDAWWQRREGIDGEKEAEEQCLITGKMGAVSRLQPKIKGAAKGDALLVSFNDAAYESYGKEQSFNAPISESASREYGAALNALLDGPMKSKHRMTIADATIAFWTDRPSLVEDVFALFADHGFAPIAHPESQDNAMLQKLDVFFQALRMGVEKYADVDRDAERTHFFLLGLSPNQGRLSVRFFLQGSVLELLDKLRQHYNDTKIVRKSEFDTEFPRIKQLLDQTCPPKNGKPDREKTSPILAGPLLRAIITGTRYPDALYSAVIRRIRADREINYLRACVIKGYLVRNQKKEISMSLDEKRTDPAYRMGRLFAVLEKIQEDAFHEQTGRYLEKGIRDTFFGSACATPASVFPRLERLSTHHRRQLSGWKKHDFDEKIAAIKWEQDQTPPVFALAEQGEFILGYYHQWKQLRMKKEDREENNGKNQEEK